MKMSIFMSKVTSLVLVTFALIFSLGAQAAHPNLVMTAADVSEMRKAITKPGRFSKAYSDLKAEVDLHMAQPITVPVPKDGGGGYTHEQHKKNYQLMYNAGILYQLSQDKTYADYVRDMFLAYAEL